MKTAVIGSEKSATEVKDVKGAATDKTNIRPNVPLKEEGKKDETKDKPEPTSQSAAPKEADRAGDLPFDFKAPALNLDSTIKIAMELNRKINQRGKLLETIDTLETFEVAQKDDADETESNHFQRCELTIGDDKGREFTTKNPYIINAVAKMVNQLCVDKLAEIEVEIQFPNQK